MNDRAKVYIESLEKAHMRPEADRLIPQGHELYPVALLTTGVSAELLRVRKEIRRIAHDLEVIYPAVVGYSLHRTIIDRLEKLL